jgi:SAM-dependent methyltransferase
VWPAGPVPIDLDAAWPTSIIATIVTSFSAPRERVVLLPWPVPPVRLGLAAVGADGVIDHAPGAEADAELADALDAIAGLDRAGRVVCVAADPSVSGPASRPFWADLVAGPDNAPALLSGPTPGSGDSRVATGAPSGVAQVDLIITSLHPEHAGDRASDLVAVLAARLLRTGGILVVLTHCDWIQGELTDPTGTVVASAQNADLLYLQHIVALYTPVRDGEFTEVLDGLAADEHARTRHRAAVRGLPAPHRRVHSDVLVFAQPADHEPPRPAPADAAFETGVIR